MSGIKFKGPGGQGAFISSEISRRAFFFDGKYSQFFSFLEENFLLLLSLDSYGWMRNHSSEFFAKKSLVSNPNFPCPIFSQLQGSEGRED